MKKAVQFIFVCSAFIAFASCGSSKASCDAYKHAEVIKAEQASDLAQK